MSEIVPPLDAETFADPDHPVVEVTGTKSEAGIVLICEHASAHIPERLEGLGLHPSDRLSHAVWDPGALAVAEAMRDALGAPLVAAGLSRLVYDCNRPPDAPSAMPERSEIIEVPGNRGLSAAARAARVAQVYAPFTEVVERTIARAGRTPVIVTVHSFTPVWHGEPRRTEIGFLHDADSSLAEAMIEAAPGLTSLRCELNAPYAASDGVTHTLARFATAAGLPSVMIEVRNDLIDSPARAARTGQALAEILWEGLAAIGHPGAGLGQAGAGGGRPDSGRQRR